MPPVALLCCVLLSTSPDSVGMSAERLVNVDRVVERALGARGFPGAAVVVGRGDHAVWARAFGNVDWSSTSAPVDIDSTLYDLASLTKAVATTSAIMVLYDRGRIRLDDLVAKYLPAFRGRGKPRVTVRMLLEHRGGLPAGRELWREARHSRARARRLVLATPLVYEPGTREIYSDLGADILGFVVEAVAHQPLDRFVRRNVFAPLGMTSTVFRPGPRMRRRAAPTELYPPRGHPLRGEVHDEDAYTLGGVAGHAGLFSTAHDLALFAEMMLGGGRYHGVRIVRESTVKLFTTRAAGTRALGWDTCAGGASCGQHMSERAYGHTGFTGTSIWIDPDRQIYVIVLTNMVHERPDGRMPPNAVLADVRADIVDIAALSVDTTEPLPSSWRAELAIGWHPGR